MTTFYKWFVTIGLAVAAGIVAYSQVHEGPPITVADWWKLLVVTLSVAGFGAGAKVVNKQIDKVAK
jgi:hypothetical protein